MLLLAALPLAAELRTDIEFSVVDGVRLTLDAWIPEGAGPFPAVIVVHGGGFTAGDKQTFVKPLFEPLTKGGFAWFTINYRLAPQYRFPAAVEDVERAVVWVRAHAGEYKADHRRIALVGESAGGHLVSFVGAQNRVRVAAVVSFYGPHDFEARARERHEVSESTQAFLGVGELNAATLHLLREASPITYVHRGMPPFLLIHGTQDAPVPYQLSVRMCERMQQAGASCELFPVAGAPHGIGAWENNPAFQGYKDKMVAWLHRVFKSLRI